MTASKKQIKMGINQSFTGQNFKTRNFVLRKNIAVSKWYYLETLLTGTVQLMKCKDS